MNITDVRIRRINSDGKMKAVASITFDEIKDAIFAEYEKVLAEGEAAPEV